MAGELFTPGAFDAALDQARDALAELGEIDGQLDWLRAQPDVHLGGLSFDLVPGERSLSLGSGTSVHVRLGRTYPFDVNVMIPDGLDPLSFVGEQLGLVESFTDRARGPFAEIAAQARRDAEGWRAGWADTVRQHTTYSDADFLPALHELERVHDRLRREIAQDDVAQLGRSARAWQGAAADAFNLNFYRSFDQVRSNQCWLLNVAHRVQHDVMVLNAKLQGAFMSAVTATNGVLDAQLRLRHDHERATTTKEALGITSAAAGTLAGMSAEFPPVSAFFIAMSGATGMASSLMDEDAVALDVEIEGSDAATVAASFGEALRGSVAGFRAHDGIVAARAQEAYRIAQTMAADGLLVSPRPFLGVPVTPCGFHHATSPLPD
ncbi:hypothetical protein ABFT23_06660 [Nocardioides sp. C4-1]|uniref:hypothetical protein n=1 Tax=Nocardioides sp. C4-1 TaxID=3151851 RepID=UPI003264CD0F